MSKLVVVDLDELDARIEGAVARALEKHQAPAESDWMTPADVCEHARISLSRLDKCVREGLPCHRVGTVRRFRRTEVDTWFGGRRLRVAR